MRMRTGGCGRQREGLRLSAGGRTEGEVSMGAVFPMALVFFLYLITSLT